MLGMTLAVLLTVCLNLASMLMARGRARRKEFAVRLALGGGRAGIVRQLLTEGALLSLVGGGFGVALGLYGVDALLGLAGQPRAGHHRHRGQHVGGAGERHRVLLPAGDARLRRSARP